MYDSKSSMIIRSVGITSVHEGTNLSVQLVFNVLDLDFFSPNNYFNLYISFAPFEPRLRKNKLH